MVLVRECLVILLVSIPSLFTWINLTSNIWIALNYCIECQFHFCLPYIYIYVYIYNYNMYVYIYINSLSLSTKNLINKPHLKHFSGLFPHYWISFLIKNALEEDIILKIQKKVSTMCDGAHHISYRQFSEDTLQKCGLNIDNSSNF